MLQVFPIVALYFGFRGLNPSWLPIEAKEWVLSGLALLTIGSSNTNGTTINRRKEKGIQRHFVVVFLGGIIWLCAIWGIHFEERSKRYIGIPVAMIVSCLIYLGGERILQPLFDRTKSKIDDLLYEKLISPACITIMSFGCLHTAKAMDAPTWVASSIWSVIIITLCYGAQRSIYAIITHIKSKPSMAGKHTASLTILQHVSKILAVFVALYFIMIAFGRDPTHWLTFGTLVTAGIAYAAQDTLGSIFASAAIMVDSPYQEGDHLLLEDGLRGQVTDIGFRSTRIQTNEDVTVIIPNSTMANSKISTSPRTISSILQLLLLW